MNSLADVQLRRIRRCLHSLVTLTQQLQLLIWFYYGVSLQWWSSQFSFVTIILRECKHACLLACLVLELDGNWGHKSLPFVFLAWEVLFLRPYNIQLSCLQKHPSKPWLLDVSTLHIGYNISVVFFVFTERPNFLLNM